MDQLNQKHHRWSTLHPRYMRLTSPADLVRHIADSTHRRGVLRPLLAAPAQKAVVPVTGHCY